MIAETVYVLCGMLSALCALMLYRKYRQTRTRLLFWSCVCFVALALNNVVLFTDMIILPTVDLSPVRMLLALLGGGSLLFGFIWGTA